VKKGELAQHAMDTIAFCMARPAEGEAAGANNMLFMNAEI